MVESQIEVLTRRLAKDININIERNWLNECMAYFQSMGSNGLDDLYDKVVQQILLAGIENVLAVPSIPNEFKTTKSIWILQKNLFLQMQSIIEISKYLI
jgi:hypothetical protein